MSKPSWEARKLAVEKLEARRRNHLERKGEKVDWRENRNYCEKIAEKADSKPWGESK